MAWVIAGSSIGRYRNAGADVAGVSRTTLAMPIYQLPPKGCDECRAGRWRFHSARIFSTENVGGRGNKIYRKIARQGTSSQGYRRPALQHVACPSRASRPMGLHAERHTKSPGGHTPFVGEGSLVSASGFVAGAIPQLVTAGGVVLAALAGAFIGGSSKSRQDRLAWERSRRDLGADSIAALLKDTVMSIARTGHAACWLTWKARTI